MSLLSKLIKYTFSFTFIIGFLTLMAAGVVGLTYYSVAPANFPPESTVSIKEGSTLSQAANMLEQKGIVRSAFIYKIFVVFLGGSKNVIAGDYLFKKPQSTLGIAYRTIKGDRGIPQIKVTILEGMATPDIARLLKAKIPKFDSSKFLTLAKKDEGYLFPDTYYFYNNVTPAQVVEMMRANFEKQTKKIQLSIAMSGRSFDDVLKMASIVEKEASIMEDRKMIAGVLWKRFDTDFALQVDAPFFYTLGKDSSKLTMADLTSDSPYNLYTHKGLPPTPINNPGLDAILATINPIKSDYWFYLADSDGITHFAVDHQGHIANRDKYINN